MPGRGLERLRRSPVLALVLLPPTIAELLTGSTPVDRAIFDPIGFALGFLGLIALYGGGALLVREAVVRWDRGWASVLLLGAAYGIGEEGFAVHTFFQPSGAPVNALAAYGRFDGVNGLWALDLTTFHAIYSIALPILLVALLYPAERRRPWLGGARTAGTAAAYLGIVALFAVTTPNGPTPALFAAFLAIAVGLIVLARVVPRNLPSPRAAPAIELGRGAVVVGLVPFAATLAMYALSAHPIVSAIAAAAIFGGLDALAATVLLRAGPGARPERTAFGVAVGLLGALFVWDLGLAFGDPAVLIVTALIAYLMVRVDRAARGTTGRAPPAALVP